MTVEQHEFKNCSSIRIVESFVDIRANRNIQIIVMVIIMATILCSIDVGVNQKDTQDSLLKALKRKSGIENINQVIVHDFNFVAL